MGSRGGALFIAAVLGVGVLASLLLSERVPDPLVAGRPAPDFVLPQLGSDSVLSLAELSGRVVLVNFWATWCKPCEDEMPAMERLYRQLREQGFELVAISVDEQVEDVAAFRDRLGLSFPILLDPKREVADAYQAFRYPESFLIDRNGTLSSKYIGPREWDAPPYGASIRRLLDGQSEPGA